MMNKDRWCPSLWAFGIALVPFLFVLYLANGMALPEIPIVIDVYVVEPVGVDL